ncbi:MAG: AEC family transporter [Mogibacterium sp.]|nr:AEC family transporter [Mogibacterium sp.]
MLQNFILCFNAVLPSMIYLAIGIILRMNKVIDDRDVKRFTHIVFVALYPFIMFDNLYGKNIGEHLDFKLGAYALGFTILQFAVSWVFVFKTEKDNYDRGAMIQALLRSNFILMGFPIAMNLFGRGNITPVAIIMLLVIPFYNIATVVVFETFRGGKVDIKDMVKRILTNPIIDGGIAAAVVMLLHITLPETIANTVTALSDCTSPIALILLGAGLNLKDFESDTKKVAICTFGKLVFFPAFGIAGAVLIGLRGVPLVSVTLMVAAPVALASYAMASSMGGNGRLAGELVVTTTLISCLTIPVWLFILRTAGMF